MQAGFKSEQKRESSYVQYKVPPEAVVEPVYVWQTHINKKHQLQFFTTTTLLLDLMFQELTENIAEFSSLGSSGKMLGMAQSCTRGGSDWTLGSISSLRGWSDIEISFLLTGSCSRPQAWQCSRGIGTISFNFWSAMNWVRQLD